MLDCIERTAKNTIDIVGKIRKTLLDYKHQIRTNHPTFYSQDLINNLFCHPYTKIEYIERDLNVSRPTASKYLETLVADGLLHKENLKRQIFMLIQHLFQLLSNSTTS
jgi:Fic family protein